MLNFPNMKTIKVTWLLWVALLSPIIRGQSLAGARAKVDEIMRQNGTINNIFKPLEFLNLNDLSIIYKGELGPSKKMVAMKISPILLQQGDNGREYRTYTQMNAINNAAVENYGIPAVYYHHANWEGCTLLALTLLEPQFTELIKTPNIRLEDLDVLIIMREFVRITKYIHGCGVCHGWAKPENMMFYKNQGFIIDFNWSEKVNFQARPHLDCRKIDWRRFLVGLCHFCGLPRDRFPYNRTQKNIENMQNNDGLRSVLMNFAEYSFKTENAVPSNYNQMHKIITDEINRRGVQEPALVSWLTDDQKNEARAEMGNEIPAI